MQCQLLVSYVLRFNFRLVTTSKPNETPTAYICAVRMSQGASDLTKVKETITVKSSTGGCGGVQKIVRTGETLRMIQYTRLIYPNNVILNSQISDSKTSIEKEILETKFHVP